MPNLHKQFKDALLSVTVAIPGEGESVASNIITLHESRKAQGQEIEIQFPELSNLAEGKQIQVQLQHSDTGQESVAGQGKIPPFDPPGDDSPPKTPPKRDPKQDPETPKDPKKDPKQPDDSEPDKQPENTGSWETVLNAGLALVVGPQVAAVKQYLPLPVDIKKFVRAVVSVDKDAGDNTGLVTVSLVF